jgi:peptidoglycan/xylan/chitin deacetylase (PgdA/CDA1 family)
MRLALRPVALWSLAILAAANAAATLAACSNTSSNCPETTSAAVVANDIYGQSLPADTLALTFDDGPGPRTEELADYLTAKGIKATFFMVGKNAVNYPALLAKLKANGHLVANHTQNHNDLTTMVNGANGPANVVNELTLNDNILAANVDQNHFLFRAPYFAYNANVYAAIHASPMDKYVGPVRADMGTYTSYPNGANPNPEVPANAVTAADWDCWQTGQRAGDKTTWTTQQCADIYLKEIRAQRRGIILMHDIWDGSIAPSSAQSNTIDLVKTIVPILQAENFKFVRADEVPDIAAYFPKPPVDAGVDAAKDAGPDASDAGPDAARDAAADGGADGATDGAADATVADAGHADAAVDATLPVDAAPPTDGGTFVPDAGESNPPPKPVDAGCK